MKNLIRIAILASAIVAAPVAVRAELFQTITVNVVSPDEVRVNGAVVPIEAIPETVAKLVKGPDRIHIQLIVPLSGDDAFLKKLIALCRKAGATKFEVTIKS